MSTASTRIHPLWPSVVLLAALILLFAGERVFSTLTVVRISLAGAAGFGILVAMAARWRGLRARGGEARPVRRLLLGTTAGVATALALYAPIPLFLEGQKESDALAILWTLWPIALASSVVPLIAVEFAAAHAAYVGQYEHTRIRQAFERSLSLALLVSFLFLVNMLANLHGFRRDLSYGRKAIASETTRHAVRDMTTDVEVMLFYPRVSEIAEILGMYFDSLTPASPHLKVQRIDYALAVATAREMEIQENGWIAVRQGKKYQRIRVGEKMSIARDALRKLDASFVGALLKVTREKKTAYFTTGHGERSLILDAKEARPTLTVLKELMEANHYKVRRISIANGLGDEIPEDAAIVFIVGPEKPFAPEEIRTVLRALARGARFFIALDPSGDPLDDILGAVGLTFHPEVLANDRSNIPLTRTETDRYFIWSNIYSSHESLALITRTQGLATIFDKAGYLTNDRNPRLSQTYAEMILSSMDGTHPTGRDGAAAGEEKAKQRLGLVSAVTHTPTVSTDEESRMIVVADADPFADRMIKFEGNVKLLADVVYWLGAEAEPIIPVSEADVQIVHRKEKDAVWFYATSFGLPAFVLVVGLFRTRSKKRSP